EMLWSKISKGLSAGRVQSVALRIICDREREILAFVPKEYWILTASFEMIPGQIEYKGRLFSVDGQKAEGISSADALRMADAIEKNKASRIGDISRKRKLKNAPPPFITSTLQQAAVQSLRMSASNAMRVAQQLYEGVELVNEGSVGLITYMRTDSFSISKEALSACRNFIAGEFGSEFLPESPNFFRSAKGAQEAHEAIRPTDVNRKPDDLKSILSPDQFRLYSLIWKRFAASQMKPAEYDVTTVSTVVDGADSRKYEFRTIGSSLVFQGFLKIYDDRDENEKDEDVSIDFGAQALAELKDGAPAQLKKLDKEQKFTEPPARFSEATLIRELESNGIGRPSTYATILSTILSRKYVDRAKGRLIPTELGFKVNDTLVRTVPDLFQVGFTAEMETELDKIEEGDLDWKKMLKDFYGQFSAWLKQAKAEGAPDNENAKILIETLGKISKWNPPEKAGRRKYDDKKFYNSVKEHFKTNDMISEKQWKVLVSLAAKYKEQIKGFDQISSKLKIEEMLRKSDSDREERMNPETQAKVAKIAAIVKELAELANADSKPSEGNTQKKGRYDDSVFLNSFLKRLERGIPLSDKQAAVLGRIVFKNKDRIKAFDEVSALLGSTEGADDTERRITQAKDNERIKEILAELKTVENWKEGRGRRNDKSFFISLSRQFAAKGFLSEKQFAALEKMAARYSGNGSENEREEGAS
ncbi:MAG TPA: type I DNA topoisomerase, partial [Victivallales bacterium]|nr:type I DNA topoisomerase [Victivallales bacterium]